MSERNIGRLEIDSMDSRYRARLINSVSGYKSAHIVGTRSSEGLENLAIISSVVHLGAHPPLLGMIMRPHTVRRDTLENLIETGVYTLNHISSSIVPEAHQTSAKYDKADSEFDATGLTPQYNEGFNCPFVAESPIKMGMKYLESLPIAHNGTILVIGEIMQIQLDDQCLQEDGFVSLEKADIACISGLDAYLSPQATQRYEYAKPNKPARPIGLNGN